VRTLPIVHQPDAGPGVFADEFAARRETLESWNVAEGADPPGDPRDYDAVLTFGGAMDTHQARARPGRACRRGG
jgi:hypothetical protein